MSEVDDDLKLIEGARKGDADAFSQLFERYQRPIYHYAAYMCGREAGDDVVQETFMALLRQKKRDDAPRGAGGYLFGIARHLIMKRLAQERRLAFEEPTDDALERTIATGAPTALDDLTRTETIDEIRSA